MPLPALSVCFRIKDIFDNERFENSLPLETRRRIRDATENESHVDKIQEEITIADTFQYTPSNSLIASCIYRRPESYDYHQINGTGCLQFFNTSNFYLMEYLCYRIRLIKFDSQVYRYRSAAYALAHAGLLYSVSFNISSFKYAAFMKIILNERDDRPFRSSAFTSPVARLFNPKTQLARYNYFTLTYYIVKNYFLEAPYKTKCIDYKILGYLDAEDCIKKCLVANSLAAFDRYPYSVLEQEKLPHKIFTIQTLKKNSSVSKMLYRLERKCQSKCKQVGCKLSYTITRVTKDPNNQLMTFNVLIPQLPNYTIKFRPKMQLIEYFIYVLSCFGTWFGLSVLSLNPFNPKIWIPPEEVEDNTRKNINQRHDVLQRQAEHYNKSCTYCSNTRILMLNDTKQRMNVLMDLLSSFKDT